MSGVASELGRCSTNDFSPKENLSHFLSRERRTNAQPAKQLGSRERGSLEEAGFRAGPLPAQSVCPWAGKGLGPLPSPGAPAGIPLRALRAEGLDPPAGSGGERHLNPPLPGCCGPRRSPALLPLGCSRATTEAPSQPENTGA